MASTGDPSTFTFTMDAMPGYTYFDQTKKVLCVMQIIDDNSVATEDRKSVMAHTDGHLITGEVADQDIFGDSDTAAKGDYVVPELGDLSE